jgi:signal transduction histidine kinase
MTQKDTLITQDQTLISLINSMNDGVLALDSKYRIKVYNASSLGLLDINTITIGSPISKLFRLIDKNNQKIDIIDLIQKTNVSQSYREYRYSYEDGSVINISISISEVKSGYGQKSALGYVLLFRDITKEKSLEEERDEFISVVSHELRTPIAISEGNISNAQFIVEKGNIQAIKDALEEAHKQILFLADMINDLATLSRAERGVLEVNIENINVANLVKELATSYQKEAEQKGLIIKTVIDPNLSILKSSQLYVKEILQNFITNSLKYTNNGHIQIKAQSIEKGVKFEISDTGIGISKTEQAKVFDKFFRSEDYRTRASNGTGLGLYVTMKLARLIHADISLESELNKGSNFMVSVPNLA